jgi:short-subunit dehydrogenase
MNTVLSSPFARRYGPWAVVTGASSGIGRATARELAARGLNVVLVARGPLPLEAVALELKERFGVQPKVVLADLAEARGIEAVLDSCRDLEVGLFVGAAGFGTSGPFLAADLAVENSMLAVNCGAVLALTHEFARRFAARGRGGIILFGSLLGFQGAPNAAHYAATKAYVQTLAEALHLELAPRGVEVLCSAPGPVQSGFAARARMTMGLAETPETVARVTVAALGHKMTTTPGAISKLLTYSLMTAPRSLRVRIMGKIMAAMTKKIGSAV